MHGTFPARCECGCSREQVFALIDVQGRECGSASGGMRGIGVPMKELDRVLGPLHERVVDRIANKHRAHWDRTIRKSLRCRHDVWHDTEVISTERCTEPSEAGDDFIEDEQDAVLVADLSYSLQIAARRKDDSRRPLHGLDDHRCNGGSIMQSDEALQILREVRTPLRYTTRECVVFVIERMAQMVDARQQTSEELAVVHHAADRNTAEADAVITLLAADQS